MAQVDMGKYYKKSQNVKVVYNLGFPFDGMSGGYVKGIHGENISIGGLWPTTGIAGPGNVNKTTVSRHMSLTVLARYIQAQCSSYDTEASASPSRWMQLAARFDELAGIDLLEECRLFLTDMTEMYGNEWFEKFKEMVADKVKDKKNLTLTTPYADEDGKAITVMTPTVTECDSISMFVVQATQDIVDKSELGESGRNVVPMRSAGAKSQMLMEIPTLTAHGSCPAIFTAHIGKEIKIDQYAPSAKNLTYLKNGTKFKDVPEKFTFLMNNLWVIYKLEPLMHKDGGPEYPLDSSDKFKGDTDLQEISLTSTRNKGMLSGIPFKLVISQREGVQPELTALELMKDSDRFGFVNKTDKTKLDIALCPDISLGRTTVRGKIAGSYNLRRAFEIIGEMIQIFNFHDKLDAKLRCTPKELYDELKAKGYDWDVLLNTRGYWIFEETKGERPFLSTMDLLQMRVGDYHPWWHPALTATGSVALKGTVA